jgi:hypothetical protein
MRISRWQGGRSKEAGIPDASLEPMALYLGAVVSVGAYIDGAIDCRAILVNEPAPLIYGQTKPELMTASEPSSANRQPAASSYTVV